VVEVEVEVEQGEPAHSPEAAAAFDPLLVRERRRVFFFSLSFAPLLALSSRLLSPLRMRGRSNCPSSRQRGRLKRKERGGGERNEGAVALFLSSVLPRRALSKREKKVDPKRFAGNPSRFAGLQHFLSLRFNLVGDLISIQGSQSCRSKRKISREEGIGPRKKTKRANACFFSLDAPPCFFVADSSLSPFYLRNEQKNSQCAPAGPRRSTRE